MVVYSKAVQLILGSVGFMYFMLVTQFLTISISHEELESKSSKPDQSDIKSRMSVLPTKAHGFNFSSRGVNEIRTDMDYSTDDGVIPIGGGTGKAGQPPRLLLNQESICSVDEDNPSDPNLLVLVHSHCSNKPQRNSVRETWGRLARGYPSRTTHSRVVLIFLIGNCEALGENGKVVQEAKLYRDIVQWDFADGYGNLTTKSISGLQWARQFCPKSKLVLKADDDIYMNISMMLEYVNKIKTTHTNMLIGYKYSNSTVMRRGLWGVPQGLYPSAKYPSYCSGTAYLMSQDVVARLVRTYDIKQLPLLPVEDVFITGILAKQSHINCFHIKQFPGWATTPTLSTIQSLISGKLWGIHAVTYDRMYQIWKIVQSCTECDHDPVEMVKWFKWMKNKRGMG